MRALRFQSTLPRRSDVHEVSPFRIKQKFQSTLPRRSDPGAFAERAAGNSFNPRSREGATHCSGSLMPIKDLFQSTLPRRSDVGLYVISKGDCLFQSTLPRRSDAIYHQFSFSNIQYSLTFCTNRTFQNLQISFDKCPFNTFCYFFRCVSPDIFMYTVDSHRTRTT